MLDRLQAAWGYTNGESGGLCLIDTETSILIWRGSAAAWAGIADFGGRRSIFGKAAASGW